MMLHRCLLAVGSISMLLACSGDPEGGAGGSGGTTGQGAAGPGSGGAGEGGAGQGTSGTGTSATGPGATGSGSASTGNGGASTGSGVTTGSGDATTGTSTSSGGPMCGDGMCDPNETCESCASDCGACEMCDGASDATTALDAEEQAFFTLINAYRAENGRGPVAPCTSLNRAAQGHSEDMRDQNYFDHTALDGRDPWERACDACYELGCGPQTPMAENIAAGNSGAAGTFDQWRNSAGHNANMLGADFTVMGLGRATGGGQYGTYWTSVFGGSSEGSCN